MSSFGKNIKLNIFGESHGPAVGVVIEGLKPGHRIDMDYIQAMLDRRRPGKDRYVTRREEGDIPEILSGVFDGVTTGMPLCAIIRNKDTRSRDYSNLKKIPRPGHSDYTAFVKYDGLNDIRGGGAFSGRLTAPLVFAGAIAKDILEKRGIKIVSHLSSLGNVKDEPLNIMNYDKEQCVSIIKNRIPMINKSAVGEAEERLNSIRNDLDSLGSTIETVVYNLPPGIGEPGFYSLESQISAICFSVPGVKAIEFGKGFGLAGMKGSESNDPFYYDGEIVKTRTNSMGGILGGISNGMPVNFNVCMKPTSSISRKQESVDLDLKCSAELVVKGRHDPCIGIRAVPVMEACAALVVADNLGGGFNE